MSSTTAEASMVLAHACAAEARPNDNQGEAQLVAALRSGDEAAFARLVEQHHAGMIRLARSYVHDRAIAEEVAQETWLAVLRGLDGFASRSSLKTWIFRILANCAKQRAGRERRSLPFSSAWEATAEPFEPAVAPERFRGPGEQWWGGWVSFPSSWGDAPEERLLSCEARGQIQAAIDRLPASQRKVVLLRDVQGWTAAEVCDALQVSEANQRVLLHRGRSKVRLALETYLTDPGERV